MSAKLIAKNLGKTYRGRQVVKDVSLEVEAGEVVGLLGPNGAGKTTCFYMILGLVVADSGQVLLDDEDLTGRPIHRRARAGLGGRHALDAAADGAVGAGVGSASRLLCGGLPASCQSRHGRRPN